MLYSQQVQTKKKNYVRKNNDLAYVPRNIQNANTSNNNDNNQKWSEITMSTETSAAT